MQAPSGKLIVPLPPDSLNPLIWQHGTHVRRRRVPRTTTVTSDV
jgi:hypothetical protein